MMSNNTERAALLQQLIEADRNIAEGQAYLTRQEAVVALLDRDGHDTTDAKLLLATCGGPSLWTYSSAIENLRNCRI